MTNRKRRHDPIADYVEWTANRYNPGRYLGGNLPPFLRRYRAGSKPVPRIASLLAAVGLGGCVTLVLVSGAAAWHAVLGAVVVGSWAAAVILAARSQRNS